MNADDTGRKSHALKTSRRVKGGRFALAISRSRFSTERPFPDDRKRLPAQRRTAVRRHRHRHCRGVPAARQALRSRNRHAGAGFRTILSRRLPHARGRWHCLVDLEAGHKAFVPKLPRSYSVQFSCSPQRLRTPNRSRCGCKRASLVLNPSPPSEQIHRCSSEHKETSVDTEKQSHQHPAR